MESTVDTLQTEAKRALSIKEFCNQYQVSPAKFYLMLAAGEIAAKKNGTRTVIPSEEAERWFAALPAFTGHKRPVAA